MNPARAARLAKERNPEHYCPDERCLWRVFDARTPDEPKPCPRHMAGAPGGAQGDASSQKLSESEELLRDIHKSLVIRFGTTAPFAIGAVRAEKRGFASIPMVVVDVDCRDEDVSALVPIVRQRVFGELAERGWNDHHIAFKPMVQRNRRRRFTDQNESSESFGKNKFGNQHLFSFEILTPTLKQATFAAGGSFARLPDRKDER